MDLFAAEIGKDPVEVRRRNLIKPEQFPFTTKGGAPYDSGEYEKALDKVLDAAGYSELRAEQKRRRPAASVATHREQGRREQPNREQGDRHVVIHEPHLGTQQMGRQHGQERGRREARGRRERPRRDGAGGEHGDRGEGRRHPGGHLLDRPRIPGAEQPREAESPRLGHRHARLCELRADAMHRRDDRSVGRRLVHRQPGEE